MTIDSITQAEWRVTQAEEEHAAAKRDADDARREEQAATERLKIARANLSFLRRRADR